MNSGIENGLYCSDKGIHSCSDLSKESYGNVRL